MSYQDNQAQLRAGESPRADQASAQPRSSNADQRRHLYSRRSVLSGVSGLTAVATTGRLWSVRDRTNALPLPLMNATQAESLADSFGVVIHLNDQKSIYGNEQATVQKAIDLGTRHARNQLTTTLQAVRDGFMALANAGCQINAVCQVFGETTQKSNLELMNEVANYYGGEAGGVFSSFEGVNEPNNNGVPWVAETRSRTIDLWNRAKANAATNGIPIIGPALSETPTTQQDYLDLGDLTAYTDLGSIHMYPRGTTPSIYIDRNVAWARASYGNKPFVCTEGGYNNALNQTRLRPVPEDVAGVYGPRHMLEHYIRGNRFFRYELLDDVDPTKSVLESNWGLVRVNSNDPSTWSNKPAYTSVRNFLSLIGDRGATFAPVGLAMSVTGGNSDLRKVLLQKRSGVHYLCLWRDVSIYDAGKRLYTAVPSTTVTVNLQVAARVSVYKPSTKAGAVTTYPLTTTFDLPLAGQLYVAEIG